MSDETIQSEELAPEAEDESEEDVPSVSHGHVEPERMRVWEDSLRRLCISVDDKEYTNLRPRRVFPLSGKANYISFLDDKGKEVALLTRPRKLDKESREALDEALGRMYYVAKITRVDSINEKWGVSHWEVETNRGYAAFEVADRSSIRRLGRGRIMVTDADGNRFEIEDLSQLDEHSQALVFGET